MNNVHDYSELRKQIKAEIDEVVFQSAKEGIASGLTKAVENQFRIEAGEVEIDAGEIAKKVTSSIQKAIKREMKKEKVQGIDVTEIISLNSKNVLNEIKQMYDDEANLTAKGAKKMLAAMSLAKNQGIGEDQIREKLQFTVKDFNNFAEDLRQTTGMSQKAIDEFGQNVIAVLSDVNSHIDKIIEDSIADFNKVNSALNKNIKAEINAFNEAIKGLDDVEFDRAFADPKKYQEMEDRVKQGLVSAQRAISILLKQGDAMPALNQLFQSVVDNFVTSGGKKSQMLDFWNGVAEQVREGDSALKDLIRDLGLLKSDGSTLTISTGANNLGGLIGAENIVKARKIIEGISGDDVNYTSLKRLQELLTDAANAGANVSRILDIVNDSTHGVIMTLEEALPGKDVENLIDGVDFNPQFLQASDKAIQKLIDDLRILYDLKAGLDVQSGNIKYDELTDQFYLFDIDTKPIHKNFEEVMDDLKTFFGWQEDELRDMGDTVNAELVNKFTSRISEVYDASKQLVNAAAKGIQETQDSHSDAKLTKPLGEDFAGGYAAGIEQGKERVSKAAEGLVETATESTKRAIEKAAQEADNIEVGFVDMNQEDFSQAWKELTSVDKVSDNVAESLTDTLKEEFSNAVDLVEEAKELKEEIKEVFDDDDIFVTASGPLPWDDDYEDAIAPVKAVEKVTEEIVDNVKEASEEVKETVKTVKEMSHGEFMKFSAPSQQALKIADKIAQGRTDQTKEEIAEEIRKIIVNKDKNSYRKIAQKLASQADKELIKSQEHVAVRDYISKSGPVYLNEQVAGDLGDNLKRLRQLMGFDKVTTKDPTKTGYDVYLKGLNEATGQAFSSMTELLEFLNAKKEEEEANFKQMYEAGAFEDLTESIRIEVEKYLNNYSRLNAEQRATIDKREQNILKKKEPQKPVALTEVAQQAAEEIEKKQEAIQIEKEEEKILDKKAQDEARINAIYEARIGLKKESIRLQEEYNNLNVRTEELKKQQQFYDVQLGRTLSDDEKNGAIKKYKETLDTARKAYQTIDEVITKIKKLDEKDFEKMPFADKVKFSATKMALFKRYEELSGESYNVNQIGGQKNLDFYSNYYNMAYRESGDVAGQLSEVNQELHNIKNQKQEILDARPLFVVEQEISNIVSEVQKAGKVTAAQRKKLNKLIGEYSGKGGHPFISQELEGKKLLTANLGELFSKEYSVDDIAELYRRLSEEAERAKRKMSSKEVIETLKKQRQAQENITSEIKETRAESEQLENEIKSGQMTLDALAMQQHKQNRIDALAEETQSEKDDIKVIQEKSNLFEEEGRIAGSVIELEISRLNELRDAVKEVTSAVNEKTNAFKEEGVQVDEIMTSERNAMQKQSDMSNELAQSIRDWVQASNLISGLDDKTIERERIAFGDLQTGRITNPYITGQHDEVPSELIDLIRPLSSYFKERINIHTHPDDYIAPTAVDGDLEEYAKGQEKGLIIGRKQAMLINPNVVASDVYNKIMHDYESVINSPQGGETIFKAFGEELEDIVNKIRDEMFASGKSAEEFEQNVNTIAAQYALKYAFNQHAPAGVSYDDFVKTLNFSDPSTLMASEINDFLGIRNTEATYLSDISETVRSILVVLNSGKALQIESVPNELGSGSLKESPITFNSPFIKEWLNSGKDLSSFMESSSNNSEQKAIEKARETEEKIITEKKKKDEEYVDWWIKQLDKQDEIILNKKKKADEEYVNWWTKQLDKQDEREEKAALKTQEKENNSRVKEVEKLSASAEKLLESPDLFGDSRESAEKFLDKLKAIQKQGAVDADTFDSVETEFKQINSQAQEVIKSQKQMNDLEEQLSQIQSATIKNRQKYMPEYLEQVAKASELIQERRNSGGSLTGEEISGITQTINASQKSNWSILTGDKAVLQRNIAKAESLLSNNYVPARFKNDLQEVVDEMRALESQTYASKEAIDKSTDSFRRINMEISKAGKSFVGQIGQRLTDMNAKFIAQYFSLMDIIRYLRTMYTEITNIDSALIELKKVTDGLTMERLQVSLENSFDTARRLGSEVTEVINTTADWARLGYGIADAEKLAEVTTLFKNVGDNMTTDTASEYLISTLKGFEMAPEEALSIVDRFNEVANNFAIDTAGIGEALERSSASFNAANTSLSESIALVTTANAVVQNPESVGTTFKTLSARIRGAKTELEELGEEEDDFTKSTSKLRDMVKGMTGFDIMEDEDTFKSIYDILLGIGKEWDNLTDVERASLGEALAGKRNANVLFAIMNNIEDLEKAYATAENAAGSATKEQENYQKSIQYSVDVLKAEMSELYTKILNSEDVKKFVDLLAQALSYIVKIADKIPTIALIGGMFGASTLLSDSRKMGNVIKFFKDIVGATTTLKQEGAAVTWKNLTSAIVNIQKVGLKEGETTPIKELAESLNDMKLPDNYQQTLLSLGKTVGLIAAITIAAYGLSKAMDAAVDSVAEIEKRMEDASEKIKDYDSKLSELNSRLDEISSLDMSQYSATQQKNLQNEAKYVSELIEQYKGLKVAYEESYAKDREKLWWGDQKYNPFSTSVDQMVSGDIGGSFETYYSSGLYKGDNKLLKFLINGALGTSAVGQFINQDEDNKSEALDNAIEQYEELSEKIDKAREKRVEYLEKANTEENTEWDNKHDAYYSQQRADAFREKADKEESKLIELNKERSDIISDVLEKQTELMEMREQLNNKSPELFTEEDALTLDKIDEELEKIQHFLDDNSNPTAVRAAEQLEDNLRETKNVYESIGALLSQDTLVEDEVFDQRYDALQREYDRELELAKRAGAELNRTVYGNIDLDDRGVLEWNEENLEKYKDAVESWGGAIEDYANSISTVDAMSEEFDGVEIAFTPMLQTPNGPEYLDSQTVHDYLNSLIEQMPEGWTNEDLLKLDAKGLEINGKQIKGLIAEIGDEAIRVGETMHYLGEDGSLNTLRKEMDSVRDSAVSWSDIRDDLVGLAQAGKLDETTLKEYPYFNLILKELGLTASEAENQISSMIDAINKIAVQNAVDDLANYRTEMNKLEDAYSKFKGGEFIDANTLSALQDAFGDLDSYQEFEKAVMEGQTDLQQYFDNIATEYAKESVVLAQLNEKNKEAVKQNLVLAGITKESADASVEAALKKKKSIESEIRAEIEEMNTEVALNKGRKDLAVSTEDLDKLTAEEIVLLMNEANASGEAARQVALFTLKKELANGKSLRNPDDLDYLSELIIKCGIAADEIDRLKRLGEMSGTIEDAQAALNAFDERYSQSDLNKNSNLQSERQKLVNKVNSANKAYEDYNAGVGSLEDRLKEGMEKVDYTVDLNFDYGGAVDSAEKAGAEAGESFKEALDKILAMYDAELDAGVVSFQTYVDKSRAIIQQYYNDGKIKASEYYDYLANLYEKQVSEYDKVISAVQRKLKEQTDELEKQKEAIEESYNTQIEEIQAKIDALQDENDEIEKNIALQKAQYELARARNQRTKLMYSESRGFYYEADLKGIQDAQENVRKAQLDKTVSDLQKKITSLQDAMKKETDVIDEQIKKLNEYAEQWGEVSSKLQNAIEDQRAAEILGSDWEKQILDMRLDTLQNFTDQYIALQQAQKDAYLEARRAELNEGDVPSGSGNRTTVTPTKKTTGDGVDDTINTDPPAAPTLKTKYNFNGKTYNSSAEANKAKNDYVKSVGQQAYDNTYKPAYNTAYKNAKGPDAAKAEQAKGIAYQKASEARKKAEENAKKSPISTVKSYFEGSEFAKAGNALVGELGSEIVLDKKSGTASIVDEPTIMKMKGGEKVFNAEETEKILKSQYVPMKQFDPKKFKMLHAFANGTHSPMQSVIAAQAVGIANGLNKGLIPATATGGQTINQTFNVSLPNITDASKASDLFREFEQLQRKATQFFN